MPGSTLHIIFPVNLYQHNPYLKDEKKHVALIEETINFSYLSYHKLKLVLHRSSMKKYFEYVRGKYTKSLMTLNYFDFDIPEEDIFATYRNKNIGSIEFIDPTDHLIVNKWKKIAKKHHLELIILPTLNFLITQKEIFEYGRTHKKYYHDRNFYPYMRKKLNILVDAKEKPCGGKWSFDKENRNGFAANQSHRIQKTVFCVNTSKYVTDAVKYIEQKFPNNYGKTDHFIYPITHLGAKKWLKEFVVNRLKNFGTYQDIVKKDEPFLFHSVLSVSLNIGLLTDKQVLDTVMSFRDKIPLNSLEGFLRQLIGWKQFVFFMYETHGEKIRRSNFLRSSGDVPKAFWEATTGIPPVDDIIRQVNKYAYAHHIQRLMFLGNFLLLCGYHPKSIGDWFHAFVSIDAYDVFMIPNVYEMVCFSAGGIMMTRPYFSSSKYIMRMSDYKAYNSRDRTLKVNGGSYLWTEIWDSLYYRFVYKHQDFLKSNYSTAISVVHLKKKGRGEISRLCHIADSYCLSLN